MYAHDTSYARQATDHHAVVPQWFHTENGRDTHICGLCGGLVVRWVTDHGTGWVHA